jgi:hypothetical protein
MNAHAISRPRCAKRAVYVWSLDERRFGNSVNVLWVGESRDYVRHVIEVASK